MSIQPPLTELDIETASLGVYEGFSIVVTIRSKVAIGALILWAVVFPEGAGSAFAAQSMPTLVHGTCM